MTWEPSQATADQATPDEFPKYFDFMYFWHESASDRRYEALDPQKCRSNRALSICLGPRADL